MELLLESFRFITRKILMFILGLADEFVRKSLTKRVNFLL
jgi:hypothetical protein